MRTPGATPSRTLRISTSGVLPIRSSGDERRRGPSVGINGRASDAWADMTTYRASPVLSPPGDGGHDRQLVARLERRLEVLQEADVLAVDEDVDEAADLPGLVADAVLHSRVALLEVVDQRGDRGAVGFDGAVARRVAPERGGDSDLNHGDRSSLCSDQAVVA